MPAPLETGASERARRPALGALRVNFGEHDLMGFFRRPASPAPLSPGATRKEMDQALRAAIDAHLRPIGFTGSLPHLRRRVADRIDLITVQHYSAGGSFVVEVACAPPEGFEGVRGWIEPAKVCAQDINSPRPRLGAAQFPEGDHWFVYGPRSYEDPDPAGYPPPADLAAEVVRLVAEQGQPWWETRPFPPG